MPADDQARAGGVQNITINTNQPRVDTGLRLKGVKTCDTVEVVIKEGGAKVRINADEFDPDLHTKPGAKPKKKVARRRMPDDETATSEDG